MLEQSRKVLSFTLHREWLLAVSGGDTVNILRLLDQDPSLFSAADPVTGFSALHWLAKHGHQKSFVEVISHAQEKGCPINVNIRTAMGGFTPLCLAAQQGHASLIEVLVKEYKADTSLRDYSGRKAWQYLPADASRELMEKKEAEMLSPMGRKGMPHRAVCVAPTGTGIPGAAPKR
uniref:Sosondowah ankyrin repeat domain family member D n=1 Tax=Meleagris gallopavo TaxID=9103 RepID=A0A803YEG9_MELGA